MTETARPKGQTGSHFLLRPSPAVALLFVGSGCAALIYEVVWFQMLQLVIGSTAVSLALLLATFMGGMCLGSLLAPRLISTLRNPLRVYAALELGIGAGGLVVLLLLPPGLHFYSAIAAAGQTGILLRAVFAALFLLPPTILMGATLPVIARGMDSGAPGASWLGLFYGGNTAGAMFGCLIGGFYLLRVHDIAVATYCAAGVNLIVALLAYGLSRRISSRGTTGPPRLPAPGSRAAAGSDFAVYLTLALSGFAALGAEVIWTRSLSLLLGGTVYAFSIILAVFLAGLSLGSGLASIIARRSSRPLVWLGGCQLLQGFTILWAAYLMMKVLPFLGLEAALVDSPRLILKYNFAWCVVAVLPSAVLWGASFPFGIAGLLRVGADPAWTVAKAYVANTIGAVLGSIGTALTIVPTLGVQAAQRSIIVVSVAGAVVGIAWHIARSGSARNKRLKLAALSTAAVAGAAAIAFVPPIPWQLVAFGRQLAVLGPTRDALLYLGEGINSDVAVTLTRDGVRSFHVAGKIEATTLLRDMRLQRMLGHIPAVIHPAPRSVLVVGCGTGVTAGAFTRYPGIERIVICEIEPLIPQNIAGFFEKENYDVVRDPRVEIVYDDARHFILTTSEKFDIITSDPIHPWVKGSATLYTQEYFELCRRRLNPGGIVTQWVPLYQSSEEVVKSQLKTFFQVFPTGTVWGNERWDPPIVNPGVGPHLFQGILWRRPPIEQLEGYDVVVLGFEQAMKVDVDAIQARLDRQDFEPVRVSLDDVGLGSAMGLFSTYAGRRQDFLAWLGDTKINRDKDLRLQYLAGLSLNHHALGIYREMLLLRRFPGDLFTGSPSTLEAIARVTDMRLDPGQR